MILDFDLGNTRLKGRVRGTPSSFTLEPGPESLRQLGLKLQSVEKVCIASVASMAFTEECIRWIAKAFAVAPERPRVQLKLGQFETAYDVGRLGVDRWLAALAAWHHAKRSCVVVDAGTALTVDVVSAHGVHQGGYIVPGYKLMLEALWQGTGSVKADRVDGIEQLDPGVTTSDAVNRGVLQMLLGGVERMVTCAGGSPQVFFTGGDASLFLQRWPNALWRPDLVLDGLSFACPCLEN